MLFVGAGNASSNTGTGVGTQQGSTAKIGDVLLGIFGSVGSNTGWTPTPSWTEILDPGSGADIEIARYIADQDGTYGYGNATTGTSNNKSSLVAAFRKAAYDAIGAAATLSGTGTLTLPSVTLSKAGMIVGLVMSNNGLGTHAPPASMQTGGTGGGSGYPKLGIFFERVGAGASGSRAITVGGTPGDSAGALVGLIRA